MDARRPFRWIAALLLGTSFLFHPARSEPTRVVSLNLCADQMLALLAPERAVALSTLSRDPALSYVAGQAGAIPQVRADAEAVLRLRPDLVLAGRYGAQPTLAALERRGVPVRRLDTPRDFPGIAAQWREMAGVLGEAARGEALVAEMETRLARIPAPTQGPKLRALLWQPRGYVSGTGGLGDAVLRRAGLANAAGNGGQVGVEALLAHPPDLLVTADAPEYPSLATDMLRHPALAGMQRRSIPPQTTICAGPFTVDAVERLAGMRRAG